MADRKGPTKAQRRALASYVADLQESMRLCGWRLTIGVQFAPKKRNVYAMVNMGAESHEAEIVTGRAFFTATRAEQRVILTHELCHLIFEPVMRAVDRNWKPIGKRRQAEGNLHPTAETAVDDFAYLIADHLPLPPKGWLDG